MTETTHPEPARSYFLKRIPLNGRTVFFALCASGAVSFPFALGLRLLGYQGLPVDQSVSSVVILLAFLEIFLLPAAAFLFRTIDPALASLGVLLFFLGLFGMSLCAGM